MGLYDEIKSPFCDKETLKTLVDIYANGRISRGSRKIESGNDLYRKITDFNKEQEKSHHEYLERMGEDLYFYNMDELYSNIKNIDIDKYDKDVKRIVDYFDNTNQSMSDSAKEDAIYEYERKHMYPLSDYKDIISNYKSYTDFYNDIMSNEKYRKSNEIILNMDLYEENKQTYMDELNKMGITQDEIKKFREYRIFINLMNNRFDRWRRRNGFSCKSTKFNTYRK